MSADGLVIVMAKRPEPGASKTRLCPPLSPQSAAVLAEAFLEDAVQIASSVPGAVAAVAVSPANAGDYFAGVTPGALQITQVGQSLGDRLAHVMTAALDLGFPMVAAINADGPTLPASHVAQAFEMLRSGDFDVVLGPAEDGGYYLIAWNTPHPELVTRVTMSTPTVLEDTLAIADRLELRVGLTAQWFDVDTAADLERLRSDLDKLSATTIAPRRPGKRCERIREELVRVAAVIPALNEAGSIGEVVQRPEVARPSAGRVIVVDNGSTDETTQRAPLLVREPGGDFRTETRVRVSPAQRDRDHVLCAVRKPTVVVFIDADGSSLPAELPRLLEPIAEGSAVAGPGIAGVGGIGEGCHATAPAVWKLAVGTT